MEKTWTRRDVLRTGVLAGSGALLAACAPQVVEKVVEKEVTQVVKEVVQETVVVEGTPQVVEKEVTKVVKETVVIDKAPEGPIELQFWGYGVGWPGDEWPHGKYEQQEVDRYMAEHPNIVIQFQALGWDFLSKMAIAITAGNPPNMILRGGIDQILYALQGGCALEVELPQEFVDDIDPTYYQGLFFMGKLYQIPFYLQGNGMRVNMTLVAEAGAEDLLPPAPDYGPWDYEQFTEFMKKTTFKRPNGRQAYGWVTTISRSNPFFYWPEQVLMWNMGTDTVQFKDGKWVCKLNEPEGEAFFQWYYDLYTVHKCIPNPVGLADAARSDYWNQGDQALQLGANISHARQPYTTVDPETLVVTDSEHGYDWIFTQLPTIEGIEHAYTWGGPMLDVNIVPYRTRATQAIQPTIDFCLWFTDREHQKWAAQYVVPVRKSSLEGIDDPLLTYLSKYYYPYGRQRREAEGGRATGVTTALELVFQKVYLPMPPAQAISEFCTEIEALDWYVPA